MTLRTSCSGLPLLLPCVRAAALGTVPTLHCKMRREFLTVSLSRHKLQPHSLLHPANSGGGTPVGVLLAKFIFPVCVDHFLCYQICFVHQRALPSVANFNLKKLIRFQINLIFWTNLIWDHFLHKERLAWSDFICRPSYKDKVITQSWLSRCQNVFQQISVSCFLFPL